MDKDVLKKKLTAEQYRVTQEKGTEAPFSGKFVNHHERGKYTCVVCGKPLFPSNTKFDSGTGWPSFDDALPGAVHFVPDTSHQMRRTEIICANCGAHLGHVFDDLPAPHSSRQAGGPSRIGKRYCVNSVCLDFEKKKE